jgi:riboflavin-specific deaminase-like protein
MEFRQLLPQPETVAVERLLSQLSRDLQARDERPYTLVNFIASADGRATFAGRSGGLGDEGDRAMFHGLREQVDAVLVGTGTLRAERYGRVLGRSERRERRRARGLTPEPLACIVSRSGDIPRDIPLFAEPEARAVVFVPRDIDIEISDAAAQIELTRLDPGELTLTTVLRRLRAEHDVKILLCEGGPMLFGGLLQERAVDELFLTLAPNLTGGGTEHTITSGPELADLQPLSLRWLLERDGSLYLRYLLR